MSEGPESKISEQEPAAESEPRPAENTSAAAEETIRQLRDEVRQLNDTLLRKQAEFENIRKRLAKEKEEFLQYSLFSTLESLLPVLDGFKMAIKSPSEGENFKKGVEIIYQQFLTALQRLGVEPIETKDQFFDPNLHEAVATVESDVLEDQQIVDELQPGFMYKQRLLRPARVRVARNVKPGKSSRAQGLGSVDDSGEETILKLD
jgi:molecular chaperone GrpE